eukprot:CAMPEP_0184480462 /NCGR_PEP_ID=MMETSP0113_2-20130426/1965_1 /TAXON_ID=91329 /ORGANISM="Norrisiella sphaerica, Strain BC52" /LENGTH=498 /DNA_ID=CAMNT_0026858965 /DNA_START=218 /DNA_END=1714 /DNA_ORIENTATION=-
MHLSNRRYTALGVLSVLLSLASQGASASPPSSARSFQRSSLNAAQQVRGIRQRINQIREQKSVLKRAPRAFDPVSSLESLLYQAERTLPENARESLLNLDKQVLPDDLITAVSTDRLLEGDLVIALMGLTYLTAKPGVLQGTFDRLIRSPVSIAAEKLKFRLTPDQINVEGQLGMGGFGAVYKASMLQKGGAVKGTEKATAKKLVVKKVRLSEDYAREVGDVEIYMNRRVTRGAPNAVANFLGTIDYGTDGSNTQQKWLVWEYDGDETLEKVIQSRDFPFNMENRLFGDRLKNKEPEERYNLIVKKLMYQLLSCLASLHDIGVCHRDVKPENILVPTKGPLKLIDLGASVDLRNGFNYYPNFTLIDPTFAAPETFVMPESTPEPPVEPVAVALSPFLWLLNKPDRFDVYSAGLTFLQMLLPRMRARTGLKEFNNAMKSNEYSLDGVRKSGRGGFQWESVDPAAYSLLSQMLCTKGKRISVSAALRHPYFLSDLPNIAI